MFDALPLHYSIALFVALAGLIMVVGVWTTKDAEELAARTGLGQALVGGIFLGAATSLSGIVTSVTAAAQGFAPLAVSNALGGITVQTLFLAIADLGYRKSNLEHAAPSLENLYHGVSLVLTLGLVVTAAMSPVPGLQIAWIDVNSFLIVGAYLGGLSLVHRARKKPMWYPAASTEKGSVAHSEGRTELRDIGMRRLWAMFALRATLVAIAGALIAQLAGSIVSETDYSQALMGSFATAISTSLPELVTTIAAVRRGALVLAVAGVLGGNAFDCLFVAFADVAYVWGSIYQEIDAPTLRLTGIAIAMTAVLLLGLLRREPHGPANVGFEGMLIALLYVYSIVGMFE